MTLFARYRPTHAPGHIGVLLGWITALATGARGLDYLSGPARVGGPTLQVVESYGSAHAWGAWMVAGFFALAVSLLLRRIGPLIAAHLAGVFVYSWYGIALVRGIAAAHGHGMRFATPVAANLALHCVCLWLLGREVRRLAGPPAPLREVR